MKRAIVIQPVAMEGPGRIGEVCTELQIPVEIKHIYAGDPVPAALQQDELLIVMGGGMGVADLDDPRYPFLTPTVTLLRTALNQGRPILGICLGAQLLAHAAGARVYPNTMPDDAGRPTPVREVGWEPVTFIGREREPALLGMSPQEMVLHWHGDTFDLPAGAVRLAFTPRCANQAFRLGPRAFGLQFHVEVDGETTRRWATEDAEFVRGARGPDGPALVLAETERHAAAAREPGDRLIRNIVGCMTA